MKGPPMDIIAMVSVPIKLMIDEDVPVNGVLGSFAISS